MQLLRVSPVLVFGPLVPGVNRILTPRPENGPGFSLRAACAGVRGPPFQSPYAKGVLVGGSPGRGVPNPPVFGHSSQSKRQR